MARDVSSISFLQSWLTAVSTPVKNHGIPNETSDGALQMAKKFFALPEETKMEVSSHLELNPHLN